MPTTCMLLDGHDFPRITRPDTRHRVLTQPAPYLGQRVLLGRVQRRRDFGMESGGDRQTSWGR